MEDLIKAMGITEVEVSQLREGMAFRFVDRGDRFDMIEYFGGEKKVYTNKYDEECDYVRPGQKQLRNYFLLCIWFYFNFLEWNVCDKTITTKLGPGVLKTVSRNTKTGRQIGDGIFLKRKVD